MLHSAHYVLHAAHWKLHATFCTLHITCNTPQPHWWHCVCVCRRSWVCGRRDRSSWWWRWLTESLSSWNASRSSWSWSRGRTPRASETWWTESNSNALYTLYYILSHPHWNYQKEDPLAYFTYYNYTMQPFSEETLTFGKSVLFLSLFLRTKESIGRQEKLKEEHRHRMKVWPCDKGSLWKLAR